MPETTVNFLQIGFVLAVLALISVFYDRLISKAEKAAMDMYVAFSVVGGVLYTLIGVGFAIGWNSSVFGWQAVLITLACFAASGLPMVIGSMRRYSNDHKADIEKAKEVAKELLS